MILPTVLAFYCLDYLLGIQVQKCPERTPFLVEVFVLVNLFKKLQTILSSNSPRLSNEDCELDQGKRD